MMKKASFQAVEKPVKMPQAWARCGVLEKKQVFLRRTAGQNFGGASDGV